MPHASTTGSGSGPDPKIPIESAMSMYIVVLVVTILTFIGYIGLLPMATVPLGIISIVLLSVFAAREVFNADAEDPDKAGAIIVAVISGLLFITTVSAIYLEFQISLAAERKLYAEINARNKSLPLEKQLNIPTKINAVVGIVASVIDWKRVPAEFQKFNPEKHVNTRFQNGVLTSMMALFLGSVVGSSVMIARTQ